MIYNKKFSWTLLLELLSTACRDSVATIANFATVDTPFHFCKKALTAGRALSRLSDFEGPTVDRQLSVATTALPATLCLELQLVCVCVSAWVRTDASLALLGKQTDKRMLILAWTSNGRISRSGTYIKFIGQRSRSQCHFFIGIFHPPLRCWTLPLSFVFFTSG